MPRLTIRPLRREVASGKGTALIRTYRRTGRLELLEESIGHFRAAVAHTVSSHPSAAAHLTNLAIALHELFKRTGQTATLDEAIDTGRAAVAAAARTSRHRAACLTNLGITLHSRFECTGAAAVLAEAVEVDRAAMAAVARSRRKRAQCLTNLGIALQETFRLTQDPAALHEAIRVSRDALAYSPRNSPLRAGRHNNLGIALKSLFICTGDVSALQEAIEAGHAAVAAAPDGHPDRAGYLSSLGVALQVLFEHTADAGVLDEAIRAKRAAAAEIAHDDPSGRAGVLGGLVASLLAGYERTGEMSLLEEAIQAGREALAATPHGHISRPGLLNNLGIALHIRFARTGDMPTLHEVLEVERAAVAATPDGHSARTIHLESLGNCLRRLAARTGDAAMAQEAVCILREAVAGTAHDHPERVGALFNLSVALRTESDLTDRPAMLEEAVQTGRLAAAIIPPDHPRRAKCLGSLGTSLHQLFEATGDSAALDEAVRTHREAVEASVYDRLDHAARLNELGFALEVHFEHTAADTSLLEAIRTYRAAATATPRGHPHRARYLIDLAQALELSFTRTADRDSREEARNCFREAAGSTAGETAVRINAYKSLAQIPGGDAREALLAAEAAVGMIDALAPGGSTRNDRQRRIAQAANLAAAAAAAALTAGEPVRAVELLERARGVLTADLFGLRDRELSALREHDTHARTDFADQLTRLRARLDDADRPGGAALSFDPQAPAAGHGASAEQYRRLARARAEAHDAWQRHLGRIRALPGFAGFLLPPPVDVLARQARQGPLVYVTASRSRCDALIMTDTAEPVQVVPLTALTWNDVISYADRLQAAGRAAHQRDLDGATGPDASQEIQTLLSLLWDTVAEPVLAHLGHTATPRGDQPWPRIWWCPVGIAAILPLHAAGHHDDLTAPEPWRRANPRTVLDRVISSYALTARALAHARAPGPSASGTGAGAEAGGPRALIVPVPDTPGAALPGVTMETAVITKLISTADLLTHPTRASALDALREYRIVHFACHGRANRADPSASHLVLDDHAIAPLTVADITALQLNADLAYLSACDTAAVAAPRLADEALHITGAFHLAGYRHVIGTLWPVHDADAAELAEAFYAHLTDHGAAPPRPDRAAEALHHAIRAQRAHYPHEPGRWATHTHTGA